MNGRSLFIVGLVVAVLLSGFFGLFAPVRAAEIQTQTKVFDGTIVNQVAIAQGEAQEISWTAPGFVIGHTWSPGEPERTWVLRYPGADDVEAPAVTMVVTGTVRFYPQSLLDSRGMDSPAAIPDVSPDVDTCENRIWTDAFHPSNAGLAGLSGKEEGWLEDWRGEYEGDCALPAPTAQPEPTTQPTATSTPEPTAQPTATPEPEPQPEFDSTGCPIGQLRPVIEVSGEGSAAYPVNGECATLRVRNGAIVVIHAYVRGGDGSETSSAIRGPAEGFVDVPFNGAGQVFTAAWLAENRPTTGLPRCSDVRGWARAWAIAFQNPGLGTPAGSFTDLTAEFASCSAVWLPIVIR